MNTRKNAYQITTDALGAARLQGTGQSSEGLKTILDAVSLEQIAINLAIIADALSSISSSAALRLPKG